jgi:hypothetical protein
MSKRREEENSIKVYVIKEETYRRTQIVHYKIMTFRAVDAPVW